MFKRELFEFSPCFSLYFRRFWSFSLQKQIYDKVCQLRFSCILLISLNEKSIYLSILQFIYLLVYWQGDKYEKCVYVCPEIYTKLLFWTAPLISSLIKEFKKWVIYCFKVLCALTGIILITYKHFKVLTSSVEFQTGKALQRGKDTVLSERWLLQLW